MLLYITHHPEQCLNCGEIIPTRTPAYIDAHNGVLCEACADTLPPDEMTPEMEGVCYDQT